MDVRKSRAVLRRGRGRREVEAEVGEFRDFLEAQGAQDVEVAVKGRQRMASPIKGEWNGIFALFMYAAPFFAACLRMPSW